MKLIRHVEASKRKSEHSLPVKSSLFVTEEAQDIDSSKIRRFPVDDTFSSIVHPFFFPSSAAGEQPRTATAGSDVVQSGRPIFDDFFQHLWPYIGNNTANVVFQMVKRLWLIRIDQ
ncbi:hypothetical protein TNCV_4183701 [Trichonephila clavipes]|nr:hypothetical protein TNCV_4183701 [Trichonephila clavipes]